MRRTGPPWRYGHWEVSQYLTFVLFYVVKIHRNDWFLGHIAVICMYVDMAYCYRPSSVVCRSVCDTSEPCKNGWTDQVEDSGGPREPCIRWRSRSPMGCGNFLGGRGVPLWSIGTLSSVQKRLYWSRCRLGCGFGWPQGIACERGPQVLRNVAMATNLWL